MLQQLHFSARVLAIIGLSISIIANGLMGDWQAVKFDTCTERSIFHHPELLHTYTSKLATPPHSKSEGGFQCERINISTTLLQGYLAGIDIYAFPGITEEGLISGCDLVASCPPCTRQDLHFQPNLPPPDSRPS